MIKLILVWLIIEKVAKPRFFLNIKTFILEKKSYRKKKLQMYFQAREMKAKKQKNIILKMRRKLLYRFKKTIRHLNLQEETVLECKI